MTRAHELHTLLLLLLSSSMLPVMIGAHCELISRIRYRWPFLGYDAHTVGTQSCRCRVDIVNDCKRRCTQQMCIYGGWNAWSMHRLFLLSWTRRLHGCCWLLLSRPPEIWKSLCVFNSENYRFSYKCNIQAFKRFVVRLTQLILFFVCFGFMFT